MMDMSDLRFGKLIVVSFARMANKSAYWLCHCDCGNEKVVNAGALRGGTTKSCGCFIPEFNRQTKTTHGQARRASWTPEYIAWRSMRARCHNVRHKDYEAYGGRGITVCDEWRDDFDKFFAYIGPRPSDKHSLDRIDNDRGYEPGNVRWATWSQQRRNQRRMQPDREVLP